MTTGRDVPLIAPDPGCQPAARCTPDQGRPFRTHWRCRDVSCSSGEWQHPVTPLFFTSGPRLV